MLIARIPPTMHCLRRIQYLLSFYKYADHETTNGSREHNCRTHYSITFCAWTWCCRQRRPTTFGECYPVEIDRAPRLPEAPTKNIKIPPTPGQQGKTKQEQKLHSELAQYPQRPA